MAVKEGGVGLAGRQLLVLQFCLLRSFLFSRIPPICSAHYSFGSPFLSCDL